jgi:hypothetical protein
MKTQKTGKGANSQTARRRLNPRIWLLRHLQAALSSLGRLSRSPISTIMTVAVIGIAMALPTGLHVLLDNVHQLAGRWDSAATISLFLQQTVMRKREKPLPSGCAGRRKSRMCNILGGKTPLRNSGGSADSPAPWTHWTRIPCRWCSW